MTTARDIMSSDVTCVDSSQTILEAARMMAALDVGALPVCGQDNRLKGMITDRDIVIKVIAQGHDPRALHASELAQGPVITVNADDDVDQVLSKMSSHGVRRLPVLDSNHELIGIVAQADVARVLPAPRVGELLGALSSAG
ncbi:CBS domain-containing protein [Actinokineospora auranticolor]|uniref:CBS domain protein n=1 Tax=Actinokineospora auranticolor TaxID=155976 RepID=A0A2S6H037_9PSEU|nr:CBS domain-containing protein [Actinokineospora auranticolor]PPK70862.1 CBS domain protein [Actinokineospora auranticolor]